jgi:gliding motility-associated protein GldL
MSISELVESEGYKKFMGKLYGWGASVVIVGALFKIQHYPGASPMLVVGLSVEALIFFFSAFEPLHEELDWTLVYPELAGLDEIEEGVGKIAGKTADVKVGKTAIERFDELLEKAGGENLFEKLGTSLGSLNNTAKNLTDISGATVATENYAKSMNSAAGSIGTLITTYEKSAETINGATSKIATSISTSGESYQTLIQGLNTSLQSIGTNATEQSKQQELLAKNLSALNSVYEMQLKNSGSNLQATEHITSGINKIMQDLKDTAGDVAQYKDEISKLSKNLSALNTVYGNMLSAMNVK